MPIHENRDPLEPSLGTGGGLPATQPPDDAETRAGEAENGEEALFDDAELLVYLGEVKRRSRNYQQIAVMGMWENAEAAYRNEHGTGSKYRKDQYRNRAKYFKPKTRAAVRKNLTATRNALFASQDVLSCEPADDSNPLQRANAALIRELINHRLNNKSIRSGLPWFQIAMGARQMAQISGIVVSKQEWSYRCVRRPITVVREQPLLDPFGEPYVDEMGEPIIEMIEEEGEEKDVVVDKPVITLVPAEMALLDPNTPWIDPAQNSPTLIVEHPMHVDSVLAMQDEEKSTIPWRTVSDEALRAAFYSEQELMGIKAAREGNAAANTTLNRSNTSFGGMQHDIVAVWECFFRKGGTDYHCWTLKNSALLSDPIPTEKAYPAHRGARPYKIGTDQLEAFVLYPQSHVDSWRQAQDEINDFANLNMDGARLAVYPTAKVRAGRNIDYKAVQRRDQQGVIIVRDTDDVTWDRAPYSTQGADRQVQLLSNDFDELAGIFSQNSVQSNRQIGDTVGGMQLIAANANATSEFDLSVFIETWVEPVLSQLVMLEQYYEDDATILAIAGERAKLFQRYGVSEITDELLESQVTLTVNVGIGGSDPMQKLIKFKSVFDIATPMLGLAMKEGRAKVRYDEVFSEIFGQAGYKNGAERFIELSEQGQQQIPPEMVQQLTQALQQLQQKVQDLEAGHQVDLQKAQMHEQGETQRTVIKAASEGKLQESENAHEMLMKAIDQLSAAFRPPEMLPQGFR